MRVLVTGAKGVLGREVCRVYSSKHEVIGVDKEDFDIVDMQMVAKAVLDAAPNMVIHLAAMTDVDACQLDPDEAFRVNALGTHNVALASRPRRIPVVYVSTGMVFNGRSERAYREYDTPDPANIYGLTKLQGERYIRSLLQRYYILRTCWLYGGGADDKKFVGQIIERAREVDELPIVEEVFGNPTFAGDLAVAIRKLTKRRLYGLYHVANKGYASRYKEAQKILEAADIRTCHLKPVLSGYFKLPAPRPRMEALDNYVLRMRGLDLMPPWEETLRLYVKTHFGPAGQ